MHLVDTFYFYWSIEIGRTLEKVPLEINYQWILCQCRIKKEDGSVYLSIYIRWRFFRVGLCWESWLQGERERERESLLSFDIQKAKATTSEQRVVTKQMRIDRSSWYRVLYARTTRALSKPARLHSLVCCPAALAALLVCVGEVNRNEHHTLPAATQKIPHVCFLCWISYQRVYNANSLEEKSSTLCWV